MNIEEQIEFLIRGCVDVVPKQELYDKLKLSTQTQKPLRVKLGVDPTGTDIHLGHTVVLRRLQAFQELGHHIILVIGDYTGMVGDPTGRSATRKMLSQGELLSNAKDYQEQVFKILDPHRTEVRYNSEWLNGLNFGDLIGLTSQITVAQMLEREDFSNRYQRQEPISLVEFLYPLMQGYDSVVLEADIEFGGQDQLFNLLMGRHLQRYYHQSPQVVMTVPLLEGLDGVRKMSKSYDNIISVRDTPQDMFGKTMSIPDSLIVRYFELVTLVDEIFLKSIKTNLESGTNPRDIKMDLAHTIVSLFYAEQESQAAQQEFLSVFSQKSEVPKDTPSIKNEEVLSLVDLMLKYGLAPSRSEARRLIQQGAVSLDGNKLDDIHFVCEPHLTGILKVGKRRFLRLL